MFKELFNLGGKATKDRAQDPLADFLSSVLNKNDAAITIKINAANSKNRRNQSGDFESVDAMSDYSKGSQDILQSLGITPSVEDGLNPMTEMLAGQSDPFGRGKMGTDILANMNDPNRPAGASASADILPLMLLLMLAKQGGSAIPTLPGTQGPTGLPAGLPASAPQGSSSLPHDLMALLAGGGAPSPAPTGEGLPPELLAMLAGGQAAPAGIPPAEEPLSPLPAPSPLPVTADMLAGSSPLPQVPAAGSPSPDALKALLVGLGGGGIA